LDSRSSAGFAAAYAVMRFVLVFQYFRARAVRPARGLVNFYLIGHGIAAAIWLMSALIPAPSRYVFWVIAFAIDLGTPWGAVRHSAAVPPDAAHLPERFGLFTLILLGESVVAVMHGIEHQETWSVSAATTAFSAMAVAFVIWWWYFDRIRATAPRPVRSHRDAVRLHLWTYAHLPLSIGLVVAFAGIQLVVSVIPQPALSAGQNGILASALATVAIAMGAIGMTGRRSSDPRMINAENLVVQ
jgi:low temperature requirement protein LtrA